MLRRVQGAEHPNTLRSMNSLAWALHSSTDTADEAVTLAREALAVQARVLGAEHPDTLDTQDRLAAALVTAGRPAQAAPLAQAVVDAGGGGGAWSGWGSGWRHWSGRSARWRRGAAAWQGNIQRLAAVASRLRVQGSRPAHWV